MEPVYLYFIVISSIMLGWMAIPWLFFFAVAIRIWLSNRNMQLDGDEEAVWQLLWEADEEAL